MTAKRNSRAIVERVVVSGILVLETPAHFGNGDIDPFVDLPLSLDAFDGRPLINGTSLAGALRNALTERLRGYGQEVESPESSVVRLFGGRREQANEAQSALVVEDALAETDVPPLVELRDGVGIDPSTGAADPEKKYDLDLLPAGTSFQFECELLAPAERAEELRTALAVSLDTLAKGEIPLGARKRRGFGRCKVNTWRVWRYRLETPEGLLGSLAHDHRDWSAAQAHQEGTDIAELLCVAQAAQTYTDLREYFELRGTFKLLDTLLIRSGFENLNGPDVSHLLSQRDDKLVPVIPGTSLAGVLRARALKIANTLRPTEAAQVLVEDIFGYGPKDSEQPKPKKGERPLGRASKVEVFEKEIQPSVDQPAQGNVQQRVRIDRWTGGALDTGLFAEAPVDQGQVELVIRLRAPLMAEVALLLHVWRDLWTGDLPVGGEASIGRGRLQGLTGCLVHHQAQAEHCWQMSADGSLDGLSTDDRDWFKQCQQALDTVLGVPKEVTA